MIKNVLIIVDVQKDFCEGGSLACEGANEAVLNINEIIYMHNWDLIVASQDWHPVGHASFASAHGVDPFSTLTDPNGVKTKVWPDHCIAGTEGAELHDKLDISEIGMVIRKGMDPIYDSYSALAVDGSANGLYYLLDRLHDKYRGELKVYVCGIATDVCVRHTVKDCSSCIGVGLEHTYVIKDACVGTSMQSHYEALLDMSREMNVCVIGRHEISL